MRINWLQVGMGAGLMLLGASVYALARSTLIWGWPAELHAPHLELTLGRLGGCAPTFLHVAAMSLLTAGVLGGTRLAAWMAVAAWTSTNIAFEIGQHALVRVHLIGSLPHWLEDAWLIGPTRTYFLNGTFDELDLAGALLGGVAALVVMLSRSSTGETAWT
jgi:hypothetical protein